MRGPGAAPDESHNLGQGPQGHSVSGQGPQGTQGTQGSQGPQGLGRLRGGPRPRWPLCPSWDPLTPRQLRRLAVGAVGAVAGGERGHSAPGAPSPPPQQQQYQQHHQQQHQRERWSPLPTPGSTVSASPGSPPSPPPPPPPYTATASSSSPPDPVLSPLLDGCWRSLLVLAPLPAGPAPGAPSLVGALGLGLSTLGLIASAHDGGDGGGDASGDGGGDGEEHEQREQVSRWLCLLTAGCLLLYQLLSALDVSAHLRLQRPPSPLQLLAQHSCDALTAVLVSLCVCVCLGLTSSPHLLLTASLLSSLLVYCHHWEVYVTGGAPTRRLCPCDPRLVALAVFLVTAVSGRHLWDALLPVLAVPVRLVLVLAACTTALAACACSLRVICHGGVGRNGSTVAGTSVISPGFHIGSVMALAGMIAKKSAVGLLQAHPCAYALTFGLVATKITCKLVVAHMTRTEMFLLDSAFMGPGLLFLDQYFNSVLCELLVLCLALVLSCYDLARYCVGAWLQVAAHLHGSVMVVAPPKPASRHRDTARQQQQQPQQQQPPLYKQQPQQSPPSPYKHSSQQ
ncbi:cholinephosphotransferase 1-like [Lampetra fluviatilis]